MKDMSQNREIKLERQYVELTLHEWVKSRRYPVRATPTMPGTAPTVLVIPWMKKFQERAIYIIHNWICEGLIV